MKALAMDWKSRRIRTLLEAALEEDKAAGDLTTAMTLDPALRGVATITAQEPCVVCGLGAIPAVLELFSAQRARKNAPAMGRFEVISHPEIFDGVRVRRGQTLAVVRANAAALLSTERVILNLLERLSGIATVTSTYVAAAAGTRMRILDTRKTMPGLRALEKYAVTCGGGFTHRQDLQDGILIRSSHSALGGGLGKALANALKFNRGKHVVQVQVHTAEDLEIAIAGGAGALLLDDMTPAAVKKAVKEIRAALPHATIGVSGTTSLSSVEAYAEAGADFLAAGELTQGAPASDIVMRIAADAS